MSIDLFPSSGSLAERAALAFLAMAGSLFAYASPIIVTALIHAAGYDSRSAGNVISINLVGTAIGGILAAILAGRPKWRIVCGGALLVMATADCLSTICTTYESMFILRFLHGVASGILLGLVFAAIARRDCPERTLAMYLFVQLIVAGLLVFFASSARIVNIGPGPIWIVMASYSFATLWLLPALTDDRTQPKMLTGTDHERAKWFLIALALGGIVVYQAGEVSVYAFVIEIGLANSLENVFAGKALAYSLFLSAPVALVLTWSRVRGRLTVRTIASTAAMAAAICLFLVPGKWSFFLANLGFSVFFCVSCTYMFALASELDDAGRVAALASFASTIGESAGPGLGGLLASEGQYELLIIVSVAAVLVAALCFALPGIAVDKRLTN